MMGRPVVSLCALLSMIASGSAFRVRKKLAGTEKVASPAMWVALGDSYSSGLGIHTAHSDYEDGVGTTGCYRDWDNVPGAKYAAAHGMPFLNKACAFTYMSYVYSSLRALENEFPVDTQNKWEGSIFSLTAGGNNLRTVRGETWEVLLTRCILTPSNCSTDVENEVANWEVVETNLTSLFTSVAQFASGAKIRVIGYPRLMTFKNWCLAVPGMTGTDARWIDAMSDTLNEKVSAATSAAKSANPDVDIRFVDLRDYVTRGACQWRNRQINGVVLSLPEGLSYATLHPQQSGYDGMLDALTASLG